VETLSKIEELAYDIKNSSNIVIYSGSGVSAISGVPRVHRRNAIKLFNGYSYSPTLILTPRFMKYNSEEFFSFYRNYMCNTQSEPNLVHYKIAELEQSGKIKAVVTQAIDGLYQKAGCKNVIELNGSIYENVCLRCGEKHDVEYILRDNQPPICRKCGGFVRPMISLYDEPFVHDAILRAQEAIREADMILILGTSLRTHPSAELLNDAQEKATIAAVNHYSIERQMHRQLDLMIEDNLENVFKCLDKKYKI
jgi:NAD-dependent deacetylase